MEENPGAGYLGHRLVLVKLRHLSEFSCFVSFSCPFKPEMEARHEPHRKQAHKGMSTLQLGVSLTAQVDRLLPVGFELVH